MFNRVAFVTGASRGIGRHVADALEDAGYAVERGSSAVAPVTDRAALTAWVEEVVERHGRIDVLVNNAGVTRDGLAVRMKSSDWDLVLNINLNGAFRCSQAVLPSMMRNRWGRIINISSVVGRTGQAGQVNYAASKAGLKIGRAHV